MVTLRAPVGAAVAIVVCGGCLSAPSAKSHGPADSKCEWGTEPGDVQDVEIRTLVSDPSRYEGQVVGIVGHADLGVERNALYVSEDARERRLYEHAAQVWIAGVRADAPLLELCNGRVLRVVGRVSVDSQANPIWGARLRPAYRIEEVK